MKYRQRGDYSAYKPVILQDTTARLKRAKRTIAILKDCIGNLSDKVCLDIGCSGGAMTYFYAGYFKHIVAVDVDSKAIEFANKNFSAPDIEYHSADFLNMDLKPESFDVITCTQAYDHVSDTKRLFDKIYSLLRPGGVCFFTGRNRLSLTEPNTGLLFINFMPGWLADFYVRLFRKGDAFYEKQRFLSGMRQLVVNFKIHDYTLKVIERPQSYFLTNRWRDNSIQADIFVLLAKIFYFALPNYIWVLEKQ